MVNLLNAVKTVKSVITVLGVPGLTVLGVPGLTVLGVNGFMDFY